VSHRKRIKRTPKIDIDPEAVLEQFRASIREELARSGLTLMDLADRAGLTPSPISQFLSGRWSMGWRSQFLIQAALSIPFQYPYAPRQPCDDPPELRDTLARVRRATPKVQDLVRRLVIILDDTMPSSGADQGRIAASLE